MTRFQTGQDVTLDVESCSLDELAAQIGRAIARVLAALGDPPDRASRDDAERRVRAWISRLDPRSRSAVLATVLAPTWPQGCEVIVAEILADAPTSCLSPASQLLGRGAQARA